MAGQSNMEGVRSFAVDPRTHARVLRRSDVRAASTRSLISWDESGVPSPGTSPVSLASPQRPGGWHAAIIGPEIGLATGLVADGAQNLLIVKVAYSGTSLANDWMPSGTLFEDLVSQADAALSWATSNGWRATIGAVYWLQGESDAVNASSAESYGRNLTAFIAALRSRLTLEPTTPLIIGRVNIAAYVRFKSTHHSCRPRRCSEMFRWNALVRAGDASVARRVADVYLVDTSNLPRYPDNYLHLDNVGEFRLGLEFAHASSHRLT